jgi:hypothetical protein
MTALTLAQIQKNVTLILAEFQVNKIKNNQAAAAVAPDPYDTKTLPKNIRNFKKNSNDETNDSTLTARDVGNLTRGKTRLNIISALTKDDKVDFFKFTATEKENFGISVKTDKDVRIQILSSNGRVIADSEAKSGDKFDNFKKAGEQALQLTKGQYFIKVTRPTGASQSERPNYAIQLSSTKYFEADYDTIEKPAKKVTYASAGTQNGGGINSLLSQFNGGLFDSANGTYYNKKV